MAGISVTCIIGRKTRIAHISHYRDTAEQIFDQDPIINEGKMHNYYRDVWALQNSMNGYPGSFPAGFIKNVKRKWWGQSRLWLFSGSFSDPEGVTLDIKRELRPFVQGDCQYLPFKDSSFDFVLADPPYSEQESKDLYNLPYCSITKVLSEMLRVCKPGGHVLFLHRIVPTAHPSVSLKDATLMAVVGVYTVAGLTNIRALTVYRKNNTLAEWQETRQAITA